MWRLSKQAANSYQGHRKCIRVQPGAFLCYVLVVGVGVVELRHQRRSEEALTKNPFGSIQTRSALEGDVADRWGPKTITQ